MKTHEQIKQAIDFQKMLCDNAHLPHFAPRDGKCFDCGKNVYQDYDGQFGYSGRAHVTGCPHCHSSFCD